MEIKRMLNEINDISEIRRIQIRVHEKASWHDNSILMWELNEKMNWLRVAKITQKFKGIRRGIECNINKMKYEWKIFTWKYLYLLSHLLLLSALVSCIFVNILRPKSWAPPSFEFVNISRPKIWLSNLLIFCDQKI